MTRQIRRTRLAPLATPNTPAARRNQGWGKLVGATVLGVAGALTLKLPGAVTGMVLGGALGHWFDLTSADGADGLPPVPLSADELAQEANQMLATEVTETFGALQRAAGREGSSDSLASYLRSQLRVDEIPETRSATPWEEDLASICTRLTQRLSDRQKSALVVALYRHAKALDLGPGPARLILRDGVAALGFSPQEEDDLRDQAGML